MAYSAIGGYFVFQVIFMIPFVVVRSENSKLPHR
ncbi:hypothetical protein M2263_000220 [Providencia alcalifaciens]|nr:hypothetical protein [Providencia alcalifaciens]